MKAGLFEDREVMKYYFYWIIYFIYYMHFIDRKIYSALPASHLFPYFNPYLRSGHSLLLEFTGINKKWII